MAETLSVTDMLPNKFEPKRQHRWVMAIEGIDAFLVKSAGRPTWSSGETEIPWINSYRKINTGKAKWDNLSITIYDPIAPSGAQQTMEWIRTHHESVSGRAGYADFYKRDIQLKLLDPIGTVIELWDIKGAFLTSCTFGSLDYGSDTMLEIQLSISYDNAVMQF